MAQTLEFYFLATMIKKTCSGYFIWPASALLAQRYISFGLVISNLDYLEKRRSCVRANACTPDLQSIFPNRLLARE
jgi:hypothetical protein